MVSRRISEMRIVPTAMLRALAVKVIDRLRFRLADVALKGIARNSVSAAIDNIVPMLKRMM